MKRASTQPTTVDDHRNAGAPRLPGHSTEGGELQGSAATPSGVLGTAAAWSRRVLHWISAGWRKFSGIERARFFTIVLGLPVAYYVASRNVEPSFAAVASTERIEFRILQGKQPRWRLSEVAVVQGSPIYDAERFTGSLVPATGTTVVVRRVAQGPLVLALRGQESAGELFNESGARVARLDATVVLRWDSVASRVADGESVTLGLEDGVAFEKLGGTATYQSFATSLLRSGKVTLLKRSYFGGEIQQIGTEQLEHGDRLTFPGSPPATGFVSVDERAALNASVRVHTKMAWITPTGGARRDVTATLYDHLRNDRAVQLALLIVGSLFTLLKVFDRPEEPPHSQPPDFEGI